MDRSTAIRPVEDYVDPIAEDQGELTDSIRAYLSDLFEMLTRLGDLYGDTVQGSHARAAAAAAYRARLLANRLP